MQPFRWVADKAVLYKDDVVVWRWRLPPGKHRVWRQLTGAPEMRLGEPQGSTSLPRPDVQVRLWPHQPIADDRRLVEPTHAISFLHVLFPARDVHPRYVAFIPPEAPQGQLERGDFVEDIFADFFSAEVGDLSIVVSVRGEVTISLYSACRPPGTGLALFDLVDVLFPLYTALCALRRGAYDRFLGSRALGLRRHWWFYVLAERITWPTPLAGAGAVGFPGRTPPSVPPVRAWPEPAGLGYRGWNFSRLRTRPPTVVRTVLAHLLAHWGYEVDPEVVGEVLVHLRALRDARPVAAPT